MENTVPTAPSAVEAIRNMEPMPSAEPPAPAVNAGASISVSPDGMSATVTLTPPEGGGLPVSHELISHALAMKKVGFGINDSKLSALVANPVYHIAMPIAEGVPPVHGTPAEIQYLIRLEKDVRPKELPDGSVDYKDLGIIQSVLKDDVLCMKIPATPGEAGTNVYNNTVPARPGKDKNLPAGKNTIPSEDKLSLLAACDGHADVVGKKIQVLNTFTVRGNVSNATGNINFIGHVLVEGNVLTGFSVQATGNVTVNGSVEGAVIEAGGSIIIKGGINGSGGGSLKAGGQIKTKYIQNGNVHAIGDIESTFIYHSTVKSGSTVSLLGSKGIIVGGHVSAMRAINSTFAGGRNSYVYTQLEVGNDPTVLDRSREIPDEMEINRRDSNTILRAIHLLSEHKKAGRLTPDKLETLQRSISTYQKLVAHGAELEEEMAGLKETIAASGFGTVNISGTIYAGVKIIIGSETMMLEYEYDHSSFVRNDTGIQIMPLR